MMQQYYPQVYVALEWVPPHNAMANMQALCEKYEPSVKAYLLVPLEGSLFADFLNSLVVTFFINFL